MTAARLAELKDRIRAAGLRGTSSRAAVLACLVEAGGPVTHAEVCERISDAGLDRATVWRNLSDLTEAGLLRRTDLGDHLWRFELAQAAEHPVDTVHPHFVCTACGCARNSRRTPRSETRAVRGAGTRDVQRLRLTFCSRAGSAREQTQLEQAQLGGTRGTVMRTRCRVRTNESAWMATSMSKT
jgi:Fur family transcriptional regulator, ferric uptake regulator